MPGRDLRRMLAWCLVLGAGGLLMALILNRCPGVLG